MDVFEAFTLPHAQTIKQSEDDQRGKSLRRRRRIVEYAGLDRDAERLGNPGLEFLQIGARHRAADTFEVGGDLAANIAAVEIVEPGLRELVEGGGESGLFGARAHFRDLAVD